jgi:hypothetical protein
MKQLEARMALADEKGDKFSSASGEKSKRVKPPTERRRRAGEDKHSPLPSHESQRHFQSESIVVVLAVMYPIVLPQLVEADTQVDPVPLPPGLVTGRKSVDLVFYDPLSSSRNGDAVPQAAKYRRNSEGGGNINRSEAQKAVVRDLALLYLGKRR